jgi:hypothetical protein
MKRSASARGETPGARATDGARGVRLAFYAFDHLRLDGRDTARSGMTVLDPACERDGLRPLPFGAALHFGPML